MTGPSAFFCADLSRQISESSCGTASIGDVWLLLEYSAAWERKAVEDSALSANVKAFLSDVIKTIPRARVLLIKSDRVRKRDLTFYVARSIENAPLLVKIPLTNYEQLMDLEIASIATGESNSCGEKVSGPLFLVCTHGRRDKCCAKFGYPLYKALSRSNEEAIWQSSHVGGDRFAANLVCLPHGLFYAHVTEESGHKIIEEYRSGRVVLENYRGRACYSHPAQAAECFVRHETGIEGVDDLQYVGTERTGETIWRVTFRYGSVGALYEATVRSRESEVKTYITCDATEQKSVTEFVLEKFRTIRHTS